MNPILAIRDQSWRAALLIMAIPCTAMAELTLVGLDDAARANVAAWLTLDDLDCAADLGRVRREFQAAESDAAEALSAIGYYSPVIRSEFESGDLCWSAVLDIDPGPRTRVRSFDFTRLGADGDRAFAALEASPGIQAGEGLDHGRYEAFKRRLLDAARDRGYIEAAFELSSLEVYPEEQAADIRITFDAGPRYQFGDVRLDQDALAEPFVARYIDIEPGTPFDSEIIGSTYVALADSGYFQSIEVTPLEPDVDTRTIPVRVALIPMPRLRINYGIGFSTDTGPRFRVGREVRRFNDRGHQLTVQSQLSPVISEVSANYRLPYGDPRFEWASFDGGVKRENTDSATSESLEFGVRRVLERARGWSRTQFVSMLVEDFDVADQEGRSRLLMPGINWTRLRADNTLRPSRGDKLEFELRGAGDALGSDTSFVQAIVDYKVIRSFGAGSRMLLRARAGGTAEDEFSDLPPSVRFFAGGDNSIRGYGFESLGPQDDAGEVVGGSRLVVASVEYEYPIGPKWSVAGFVDSGNAFAGSTIEARTGAGFGARWQSPLGPIRIDVRVPVNDREHGPRLHISLGPDL